MKDCTTFLKLQEASLNKQTKQGDKDSKGATILRQTSKETTELLKDKTSKTRDTMTTKGTFHQKDTSQQ
jgi:hypothetical protein